jgi:hypothetical protein
MLRANETLLRRDSVTDIEESPAMGDLGIKVFTFTLLLNHLFSQSLKQWPPPHLIHPLTLFLQIIIIIILLGGLSGKVF